MKVLVIDVGGTHIKLMLSGNPEERKFDSGRSMNAEKMVEGVLEAAGDWTYDAVSIGYPGPVVKGRPQLDPRNLGPGWVGYDFAAHFGKPVKIVNDAAMQALA